MATNYKSSAKKRRGDPAHALIGQQPMFYQSIEKRKGVFFFFCHRLSRTLKNNWEMYKTIACGLCFLHFPCVLKCCRLLSQCNTWPRLLLLFFFLLKDDNYLICLLPLCIGQLKLSAPTLQTLCLTSWRVRPWNCATTCTIPPFRFASTAEFEKKKKN